MGILRRGIIGTPCTTACVVSGRNRYSILTLALAIMLGIFSSGFHHGITHDIEVGSFKKEPLVTGLPPKGGSLPLKLDSPIEGSSSLSIIVTPSGIEPSEVNSLPLPAKAGSPTEVSLWLDAKWIGYLGEVMSKRLLSSIWHLLGYAHGTLRSTD